MTLCCTHTRIVQSNCGPFEMAKQIDIWIRLKELLKNLRKMEDWLEMERKNEATLKYLSEVVGEPITIKEITTLVNLLNAERIHGKARTPIPEHMEQELKEIALWVVRHSFGKNKLVWN